MARRRVALLVGVNRYTDRALRPLQYASPDAAALDELLTRLGYETTTAEDGLEAWEIFERHPFELVVSDIMMPRVDGLDLCRRIRSI